MGTNKIDKHDVELTANDVGAIPIIDANSAAFDMDVIAKSGAHCAFYKTNADTLNTPYKKGISSVVRTITLSYAFHDSWCIQIAFPVGGTTAPMFWRTNTNGTISEWTTGYLPLTGGTLSNTLKVANGGNMTEIINYEDKAYVRASDGTLNHYADLIFGFNLQPIYAKKDGIVYNTYDLFGEHNKPSGSYTGNGSATARTIATGGIGSTLRIVGYGCFGICTSNGSIFMNSNKELIATKNVAFESGVLKMDTDAHYVNYNGTTYWYQVL